MFTFNSSGDSSDGGNRGFIFGRRDMMGTKQVQFYPLTGYDTMIKSGITTNINTKHINITLMKEYEDKSQEELRYEDYFGRYAVEPGGNTTSSNATAFSSNPDAVVSCGDVIASNGTAPSSRNSFLFGGSNGNRPTSIFADNSNSNNGNKDSRPVSIFGNSAASEAVFDQSSSSKGLFSAVGTTQNRSFPIFGNQSGSEVNGTGSRDGETSSSQADLNRTIFSFDGNNGKRPPPQPHIFGNFSSSGAFDFGQSSSGGQRSSIFSSPGKRPRFTFSSPNSGPGPFGAPAFTSGRDNTAFRGIFTFGNRSSGNDESVTSDVARNGNGTSGNSSINVRSGRSPIAAPTFINTTSKGKEANGEPANKSAKSRPPIFWSDPPTATLETAERTEVDEPVAIADDRNAENTNTSFENQTKQFSIDSSSGSGAMIQQSSRKTAGASAKTTGTSVTAAKTSANTTGTSVNADCCGEGIRSVTQPGSSTSNENFEGAEQMINLNEQPQTDQNKIMESGNDNEENQGQPPGSPSESPPENENTKQSTAIAEESTNDGSKQVDQDDSGLGGETEPVDKKPKLELGEYSEEQDTHTGGRSKVTKSAIDQQLKAKNDLILDLTHDLEEKIDKISSLIQEKERSRDKAKEDIIDLRLQLVKTKGAKVELDESVANLKEQLDNKDDDIENLKADLDNKNNENLTAEEDFKEQLDEKDHEISIVEAQLNEKMEFIKDLQGQMKKKKVEIYQLKGQTFELEEKAREAGRLKDEVIHLEQFLAKLDVKLDDKEHKIKELENIIAKNKREQNQGDVLDKANREKDELLNKMKLENDQLIAEIAKVKEEKATLFQKAREIMNVQRMRLNKAKEDIANLKKQSAVAELESQLEEKESVIKDLEAKVEDANRKADELSQDLKLDHDKLIEAREDIAQLERKLEDRQDEADDLKAEMESKDLIIEDMKRKLAKFQQQKPANKAASPGPVESVGIGQSDIDSPSKVEVRFNELKKQVDKLISNQDEEERSPGARESEGKKRKRNLQSTTGESASGSQDYQPTNCQRPKKLPRIE